MYKVVREFRDLQDGKHQYRVGDTFPRPGISADSDRLKELASARNLARTTLIVWEDEPVPVPANTKKGRKNVRRSAEGN